MPHARVLSNLFFTIVLVAFPTVTLADRTVAAEVKALIARADAGDADAQLRVGSAYDTGSGAPRSEKKAMRYYLMAADQGNAEAQNSLGSILQAEKRYPEALAWYQRAADQGHALATNNLGLLYDLGMGVQQDRRKGFELYSKAADLGWAESMWNLANMYGAGQLGSIDMMSACVWAMRARRYASPGDQRLQAQLARITPYLESELRASEMEKCQQQAAAWTPAGTAQHGNTGDTPSAAGPE